VRNDNFLESLAAGKGYLTPLLDCEIGLGVASRDIVQHGPGLEQNRATAGTAVGLSLSEAGWFDECRGHRRVVARADVFLNDA
jgi:hypothetical protein